MHKIGGATSVLYPLFYALFAQLAFLPITISMDNEPFLALPIVNASGIPPTPAMDQVSVSSRRIVLAFLVRGQPIPETEVKDTLAGADQAISGLVRDHPTQRIVHDRFEYRRPTGNMLISIKTNVDDEITWAELRRILQGLYRYMTAGIDTQKTHYEALEFDIEAGVQEKTNIGVGLVWYFPPTKSEVQKRFTLPLPLYLVNEGTLPSPNLTFSRSSNETLRRLPSAALVFPGANNAQENDVFPIPRSSLSLSFYFFGPSIPAQSVKGTLQGATAKVRPFLNGPSEMDPIENDSFRWVLPLSREVGVPVAVTILTYHNHEVTWRQLFDVLFGLYAYTSTFGTDLQETHYQVLGFRIVDLYKRELGVGTISYLTPGTDWLAKRVESSENGMLLQPPSAPNISSLNTVAVSNIIVYPVANTDVVLTFTYLGDTPIPPPVISGALSDAREKISRKVVQRPNDSVGIFRDVSTGGHVSTSIFVYPGNIITWKELDHILKGMLNFCQDDQDHDRVLVFEIDIEAASRGRVGFGTLLYIQPKLINVEKGALIAKDTSPRLQAKPRFSQPSLTALSVPVPYPIPGTPITLTFDNLGSPIPSIYVNAALTSALRSIQVHVDHHPNSPIPNGRWQRRGAVSNVWITVIAYSGNQISWQELSSVLAAVLRFMTEAGEQRCRDVGFLIDQVGQVQTGYGSVAYFPQ